MNYPEATTRERTITVRLSEQELARLKAEAESHRTHVGVVVRAWLAPLLAPETAPQASGQNAK